MKHCRRTVTQITESDMWKIAGVHPALEMVDHKAQHLKLSPPLAALMILAFLFLPLNKKPKSRRRSTDSGFLAVKDS